MFKRYLFLPFLFTLSDAMIVKRRFSLPSLRNTEPNEPVNELCEREWAAETSYDLPFSANVAFNAFSNMGRQASWSDHLKRVDYVEEPKGSDLGVTNFVANVFGINYGAKCVGFKRAYPYLVEWKSISGVRYTGRATFSQRGFGPSARTTMNLHIRFVPPRLFAAVFGKSKGMLKFVEYRMMLPMMQKFSEIVQKEDLGRKTIL